MSDRAAFYHLIYFHYIYRDNYEKSNGKRVNGKSITNMRYADDAVLFADNEQQAQNLLESLNRESEK